MPSSPHEGLVELFRQRPALAAELLAEPFDVDLPPYEQIRIESGDLGDLVPTEYRADLVVALRNIKDEPVLAIVVEAQLAIDRGKEWSWPVYLATLRARLKCPAILLVVCTHPAVARWGTTPIPMGHPGWVFTPLVLSPGLVPTITDPEEAARTPELTILSALAHGSGPNGSAVLKALISAFETLDEPYATLYSDVVHRSLPQAARHLMEAIMTTTSYEYQSPFVRRFVMQGRAEGRAEGEAKGEARALLTVLAARGLEVSDDARARIDGCDDADQLNLWISRAATAESVDDVFV